MLTRGLKGTIVQEFLHSKGPSHSQKILEWISSSGVSSVAARKRLQRARPPVQRLPGLTLPNGGLFWYLDYHSDSKLYWERLIEALRETKSAYGVALDALIARGGIAPLKHFSTLSGSPDARRGQISWSAVLQTLKSLKMAEDTDDPVLGSCIRLTRYLETPVDPSNRRQAVLLAERTLLGALKDWTRKLGLVSFKKVWLRDDGPELPTFGQYTWDYTAPSYIFPLRQIGGKAKVRPGFVVADVILGAELTAAQCEYFFRKCAGMRSQRGTSHFLGILIADRFEPGALQRGKERGLLFATVENFFGRNVQQALEEVIRIFADATVVAQNEPDRIKRLAEQLSAIDGVAQTIRGPLFELITGYCVSKGEGGSIEVNKTIRTLEGESVNIDVLLTKGQHSVVAYECKGRRSESIINSKWSRIGAADRYPEF